MENFLTNNRLKSLSEQKKSFIGIDYLIKSTEKALNDNLCFFSSQRIFNDSNPLDKQKATRITLEDFENRSSWNFFAKTWMSEQRSYEIIEYKQKEKSGYFFSYKKVLETFHVGVAEDMDGTEWFYSILKQEGNEDRHLTGASLEIKLTSFKEFCLLVEDIMNKGQDVQSIYQEAYKKDYVKKITGENDENILNEIYQNQCQKDYEEDCSKEGSSVWYEPKEPDYQKIYEEAKLRQIQ